MTDFSITSSGDLRMLCKHLGNQCVIETDAPQDNHGKGELFSPTDLMTAALGTCLLTIMRIVAQKLNIHLEDLSAEVQKEMANLPERRIGKIKVTIQAKKISKDLQKKIEEAALKCPVRQSFHPDIVQDISFNWI